MNRRKKVQESMKARHRQGRKLTHGQVNEIYELREHGIGQTEVAGWYGVSSSMVSHIWTGRHWQSVVS